MCRTALFAQKKCAKSAVALSGIGGNPTFCADSFFADFGSVAHIEIHNSFSCFSGVAVFAALFPGPTRLFFRLFSMSGFRHLSRLGDAPEQFKSRYV